MYPLYGTSRLADEAQALKRPCCGPKLAAYFSGVTPRQRAALAKYAADYACKEAGGGCHPVTPDLSLVTETPSYTKAQKHAAVADLKAALDAHQVPADIRFAILQAVR